MIQSQFETGEVRYRLAEINKFLNQFYKFRVFVVYCMLLLLVVVGGLTCMKSMGLPGLSPIIMP